MRLGKEIDNEMERAIELGLGLNGGIRIDGLEERKSGAKIAYLTVEDYLSTGELTSALIDILEYSDYVIIEKIESSEEYFVIKLEYDEWDDVKDLCASIVAILLDNSISSFHMTYKGEEFINYE